MRTFKPLGDRLLVLPDAPVAKKTTGLAEPPSQKEAPTEGIVVAVGPFAIRRDDKDMLFYQRNSQGVCVGERIQYAKYSGRDVMHNGVKHKLLRLEEVEGIIEDDGQ
jgi:chaperonin GroES